MNLISVMTAFALSIILLTSISNAIINMHKAQASLEYLQDKSTAVFVIQSALNCQKTRPKGNACDSGSIDLATQTGQSLASTSTGWTVGKAIITANCYGDGIEILSQQVGTTLAPTPLIPIRLCGNL